MIHCYARFSESRPLLCGILGLEWCPKSQPYLGGKFCMPVVGGPRGFSEPFEREASFDEMFADISKTHKLGAAFDWPVPSASVQWMMRLYHCHDGSSRFVARDLPWIQFRIFWLAAIGLNATDCQLCWEVNQRIVQSEGLSLPASYSLEKCGYGFAGKEDSTEKPGVVDRYAALFDLGKGAQ
jgi:hypothetical protein